MYEYFHTQTPNFCKFWKALEWKILLSLMSFALFYCNLEYFWSFVSFSILVHCLKKNLATLILSLNRRWHLVPRYLIGVWSQEAYPADADDQLGSETKLEPGHSSSDLCKLGHSSSDLCKLGHSSPDLCKLLNAFFPEECENYVCTYLHT
jgi:hypothetical protein